MGGFMYDGYREHTIRLIIGYVVFAVVIFVPLKVWELTWKFQLLAVSMVLFCVVFSDGYLYPATIAQVVSLGKARAMIEVTKETIQKSDMRSDSSFWHMLMLEYRHINVDLADLWHAARYPFGLYVGLLSLGGFSLLLNSLIRMQQEGSQRTLGAAFYLVASLACFFNVKRQLDFLGLITFT